MTKPADKSRAAKEIVVADKDAWSEWLEANHKQNASVWLLLAKKAGTARTRLRYAEALQEALRFGWIDGQARRVDDSAYFVRFSPRRPQSLWSKRNVGYALALIEAGRMHPAGLAEVERAKADGRWERAYDGPAAIEVPEDLTVALADNTKAAAMFEVLTSQNRYAILHRIHNARRPETRARRIAEFVEKLAHGETPYPQKAQPSD